jgi:dTDP-4-amino-4,6-dideoxygalactose transaminase
MYHAPIPFTRSSTLGKELQYIAEALLIGQIAGDQTFTRKCQGLLETLMGARRVLLTTSCTHALEMAAMLLDLGPGDEVIVPSFTFVSTANAFVVRGAKPVFIDVRPDTLNLDEKLLEDLITERTRAVVPVHYAGVGCEMDSILAICRQRGVTVIEDNAHGLFARYRGQPLGTFGALATQSFHETKNVTCGEGGALLVNDSRYLDRAEILREKGTNRSTFFRGQVAKYTWVDLGSSYVMSDVLAAFLYGQLEQWERVQTKRRQIWNYYHLHLSQWAADNRVRLPIVPRHCDQAHHMFYLLLPSLEARQGLIAHLKERGILAVFHYQPLHLSEMGKKFGGKPGACPVSEKAGDCLLRLPFYNDLSMEDQVRVVQAIHEYRVSGEALGLAA